MSFSPAAASAKSPQLKRAKSAHAIATNPNPLENPAYRLATRSISASPLSPCKGELREVALVIGSSALAGVSAGAGSVSPSSPSPGVASASAASPTKM